MSSQCRCASVQVWQAILTKKVDLDSRRLKSTISESARDLLRVSLVHTSTACSLHRAEFPVAARLSTPVLLAASLHHRPAMPVKQTLAWRYIAQSKAGRRHLPGQLCRS